MFWRQYPCYLQPYIVKATGCWKIDWDELEANQKRFVAFVNLMAEKVSVESILIKEADEKVNSAKSACLVNSIKLKLLSV